MVLPRIEDFFVLTDFSRQALEGSNPTPVEHLAIFSRSGRGKSETLARLKRHPAFQDFGFASGGDTQRELNGVGDNDAAMAAAAKAMALDPAKGTDRKTEIYLLGRAREEKLVMEARMAPPILTFGGKRVCCTMLDCPIDEVAERKHRKLLTLNPYTTVTIDDVKQEHLERDFGDESRLLVPYPKGWWSAASFDAVVSTLQSPDEVVSEIACVFNDWCVVHGLR